jgi:hypothetical protein
MVICSISNTSAIFTHLHLSTFSSITHCRRPRRGKVYGRMDRNTHPDSTDGRGPATEYQLIALTYTGGWYRLSLPGSGTPNTLPTFPSRGVSVSGSPPKSISTPRPRTSSNSSAISRLDKGKDKEREKDGKESRECTLQEYRRFGRWDGWG